MANAKEQSGRRESYLISGRTALDDRNEKRRKDFDERAKAWSKKSEDEKGILEEWKHDAVQELTGDDGSPFRVIGIPGAKKGKRNLNKRLGDFAETFGKAGYPDIGAALATIPSVLSEAVIPDDISDAVLMAWPYAKGGKAGVKGAKAVGKSHSDMVESILEAPGGLQRGAVGSSKKAIKIDDALEALKKEKAVRHPYKRPDSDVTAKSSNAEKRVVSGEGVIDDELEAGLTAKGVDKTHDFDSLESSIGRFEGKNEPIKLRSVEDLKAFGKHLEKSDDIKSALTAAKKSAVREELLGGKDVPKMTRIRFKNGEPMLLKRGKESDAIKVPFSKDKPKSYKGALQRETFDSEVGAKYLDSDLGTPKHNSGYHSDDKGPFVVGKKGSGRTFKIRTQTAGPDKGKPFADKWKRKSGSDIGAYGGEGIGKRSQRRIDPGEQSPNILEERLDPKYYDRIREMEDEIDLDIKSVGDDVLRTDGKRGGRGILDEVGSDDIDELRRGKEYQRSIFGEDIKPKKFESSDVAYTKKASFRHDLDAPNPALKGKNLPSENQKNRLLSEGWPKADVWKMTAEDARKALDEGFKTKFANSPIKQPFVKPRAEVRKSKYEQMPSRKKVLSDMEKGLKVTDDVRLRVQDPFVRVDKVRSKPDFTKSEIEGASKSKFDRNKGSK